MAFVTSTGEKINPTVHKALFTGDVTSTGEIDLNSDATGYNWMIIQISTATETMATHIIVPGYKIIGSRTNWASGMLGETQFSIRMGTLANKFNVISISSGVHIRRIYGVC